MCSESKAILEDGARCAHLTTRRNRCRKCDAATTEWRGWQPGCPARFQDCPAGSPALPPRQPCVAAGLPAGQPCADSRQPCAAILAALRCQPGSPALPSWQPCAATLAALRGSPARGSRAAPRWQPCAALAALRGSPGLAYFARFGAGRVPRPFTLRTLKTVKRTRGCEGPEQVLRCRRRHAPDEGSVRSGCGDPACVRDSAVTLHTQRRLPDARGPSTTTSLSPDESARCERGCRGGSPATAQGCPAGSPALPSWQPCAATLAALRCHPGSPAPAAWQPAGSPAWQPGCRHGSAALPTWQPCVVAGLPCWQPCCRTTLKESGGAHISRSPGAFCSEFFYERRRGQPPEPPERPAGAPHPPRARGRLFAPVLRLRFLVEKPFFLR